MKFTFRPATALLLPLVLSISTTGHAANFDSLPVTPEAVNLLEQKAIQANPREQCFLYTELVHSMTELAGKQMLDGDVDHASDTLKRVEHYAHLSLIHISEP